MRRIMKKRSLLLLTLSFVWFFACNRTPAIPDDALEREAGNVYRSMDGEKAASKDGADDPEDGEPGSELDPDADPADTDPAPVAKKEMKATGPVALVNNEPISAKDFNDELAKLTTSGQVPPHMLAQLQGDRREQFKAQLVEGMIMRRLIEQQLATQNYEVKPAEIDAKIEEMKEELAFANEMAPGTYGTLEELTSQMGLTEDQLRESVRQSIELERLVRAKYAYKEATQEEARAYYKENAEEFKQPEQVRASHILIRVDEGAEGAEWTKAKKQVEALRDQIKGGADFAELAKAHSEDSSSKFGGDLGFFVRESMVPEFEEAAFALKDGELSQPVRTHLGWHLIKRTGHREAGPTPFDTIETQLVRFLTAQRYQVALRSFLEELRTSASVELKLENIT